MARPVNALPEPLQARIQAGGWLRTAHRGMPAIAPGNSRWAIEAVAALGVDLVEVDVHRTIDGHLVLHHDRDMHIGRTPTPIALATLAQLRTVDLGHGEHIITLAEAIRVAHGRTGLFADLKTDGLAEAIVSTAHECAFAPLMVCGIFRESLMQIRRLDPAVGTSLTLLRGWENAFGADIIERTDTAALTVDHHLLDAAFVARCHAAGRTVLAWTVDDLPRMRELLRWGVDGITSNRPDLFASLAPTRETRMSDT